MPVVTAIQNSKTSQSKYSTETVCYCKVLYFRNTEFNKKFRDKAHCMAHMTQAFHQQHDKKLTLMAALQQLNTAEKSGDIHEVGT